MSIDDLQPSYYYLEYYDATKDTVEVNESKEYSSGVTMELFLTLCAPILVLLVFTCYVVTVLWRCYEQRNHPKVECSLCRKRVTTDSATQTDEVVGSSAMVSSSATVGSSACAANSDMSAAIPHSCGGMCFSLLLTWGTLVTRSGPCWCCWPRGLVYVVSESVARVQASLDFIS